MSEPSIADKMEQNADQIQFWNGDSPINFRLNQEDVHIWWGSLDVTWESMPGRLSLLSADEKARADRFHFERDRLRYIAGRSCLRQLLGGYLGLNPAIIEFDYSPSGKPTLSKNYNEVDLQFNLSNSNNRVLYVFNLHRKVGIDLELVHPMSDENDFARQFFCTSECALLNSLSGNIKHITFFELWTCKEALLKAMGDGLTRPINEVEVALLDGGARLVSIGGDQSKAVDWKINLFQPASGYQGALAIQGQKWKTAFYNVSDGFDPEKFLS